MRYNYPSYIFGGNTGLQQGSSLSQNRPASGIRIGRASPYNTAGDFDLRQKRKVADLIYGKLNRRPSNWAEAINSFGSLLLYHLVDNAAKKEEKELWEQQMQMQEQARQDTLRQEQAKIRQAQEQLRAKRESDRKYLNLKFGLYDSPESSSAPAAASTGVSAPDFSSGAPNPSSAYGSLSPESSYGSFTSPSFSSPGTMNPYLTPPPAPPGGPYGGVQGVSPPGMSPPASSGSDAPEYDYRAPYAGVPEQVREELVQIHMDPNISGEQKEEITRQVLYRYNIPEPLKTDKRMALEMNLSDKFRKSPVVGTYVHQGGILAKVKQAVKDPTPMGDLSLIFLVMKALDPTSTVREGEFATVAKARAALAEMGDTGTRIPTFIVQGIERLDTGRRLLPEQRKDIRKMITGYYKDARTKFLKEKEYFTDRAKRYGLNPKNVVYDPAEVDTEYTEMEREKSYLEKNLPFLQRDESTLATGGVPPYTQTPPTTPLPEYTAGALSNTSRMNSFGRGFLQDATFGAYDEAGGYLKSLFKPNTSYAQERDAIRAADRRAREAHPNYFTGGQFAGALPSFAIPGLNAIRGAGIGSAALSTAANMGVRAFNEGEGGIGSRMENVPQAAATGAALGFAAPYVARGVKKAVGKIRNRAVPTQDFRRKTVRNLRGLLQDTEDTAGKTIPEILEEIGPYATPADIAGPVQQGASRIAKLQGPGGKRIQDFVKTRQESGDKRVMDILDEIISPEGSSGILRKTLEERRAATGRLYEDALKSVKTIPTNKLKNKLDTIMQGDSSVGEIKRFLKTIVKEVGKNKTGPGKIHGLRTMVSDEIFERNIRGVTTAPLKKALQEIDNTLDTVPGYAKARKIYRELMEQQDAIEYGQKSLRGSRASADSPDDFLEPFSGYRPDVQNAVRTGIREDLSRVTGTATDKRKAVLKELGKDFNEKKLEVVLGKENYKTLKRALDAERKYVDTEKAILPAYTSGYSKEIADNLKYLGSDTEQFTNMTPVHRLAFSKARKYLFPKTKLNEEYGKFFSSQGAERDRMINDIIRQYPQTNRGDLSEKSILSLLLGLGAYGPAGTGY